MTDRCDREVRPPASTRSAWILLVIAAGCVAVANAGRASIETSAVASRAGDAFVSVPIDPLIASCAELQLLPGIGPGLARSMHHEIHANELESLEDLETLPGIGPVRAERIRAAVAPRTDD